MGADASGAYQDVFNWSVADLPPERRLMTVAVVARMLHLLAIGLQHLEDGPQSADDEILLATTAFLETVTCDFLPKDDNDEAQPPTPSPEPRLHAVKAGEEGA